MTTHLAKFLDHNLAEPWDIMFRNLFETDSFFLPAINANFKYPVDILEDEKSLNIEIAVAGIEKDDIEIEEQDGVLRVTYNKQEEEDNCEEKHYIQRSIAKRAFNFGWRISEDKFNLKKIDAKMDKGILKISIPKFDEEEKPLIKNTIKIK
jgi:HSP20 family protein